MDSEHKNNNVNEGNNMHRGKSSIESLDTAYQEFIAKAAQVKKAQASREKTKKTRIIEVAQHAAEGMKSALEEMTSDRDTPAPSIKDRLKEFGETFKSNLYEARKEGQELLKETVGVVSNPNIKALERAITSLHNAVKNGNYFLAISQLEAIESYYNIRNENYYDGGLVRAFNKMRSEIVTILSQVQGLDKDTAEKVRAYREKIFEEDKARLISILESAKAGSEDERGKLEQVLEKIELSPEKNKERIRQMRRHVTIDSRGSMDYLMALIKQVEFNESTSLDDIAKNHFVKFVRHFMDEGLKIANSTVNLSLLKGIQHAADYLIELSKDKLESEFVAGPLERFNEYLSKRIDHVEHDLSYAQSIKDLRAGQIDIPTAAKNIMHLSQTKEEKKQEMVTPYLPPQMSEAERIAVLEEAMEEKLQAMFNLAFQANLGLKIEEIKGDAATTLSGLTTSATQGVIGGLAGAVKGILPELFGLNEKAESALKDLGDKYLTDPAKEKVESTLDQTGDKNRKALLEFLLSLNEKERAVVSKAFAKLLAATFPYAMEQLVINKYDTETAKKIADKLVETSLYTLSAFADKLKKLKEEGKEVDPEKVAEYMVKALAKGNADRAIGKGIMKTWQVPVLDADGEIEYLQLEDLFGGRCIGSVNNLV